MEDDIVTPAAELTLEQSTSASSATSSADFSIWDKILNEYDQDYAQETETIAGLMPTLVGQLLHGCGHTDCQARYCATGLRNTSKIPMRDYTPRSARILAFDLLGRSDPGAHVCQFFTLTVPASEKVEGPRDPSSLVQRIADSARLKRLANGENVTDVTMDSSSIERKVAAIIRKLQTQCEPPFLPASPPLSSHNPRSVSNEILANTAAAALDLFFDLLPEGNSHAVWKSLAICINNGHILPSENLNPENHNPALPDLLNIFAFEPHIRLCAQICKTVSLRTQLEDIAAKSRQKGLPPAGNDGIMHMLADHMSRIARQRTETKQDSWIPWPYPLLLKRAFLANWDGKPVVKRGSAACGALELMEMQQSIWDKSHPERHSDASLLPFVFKRMDANEMTQSWLKNERKTTTMRHLLSFPFLFTDGQLVLYFRTLNHNRMKEAYKASHLVEELYDRYVAPSDAASLEWDNHIPQTQHWRDFYLLLTVRREHILEDAFDQLWQRRKQELVRPLRVRLGEIENAEVGQDLGGVQMEFFSLVCEAIFSEDAGMFTTDVITGKSYFRPGSLQPLYMFELFGLLIALALYNGITIPVSFPLALYKQLLGRPCTQLLDIQDGWPDIARSLQSIRDGAYEGLEYVFPLEANGVRMSISRSMLDQVRGQSEEHIDGKRSILDLQADEMSYIDASASSSASNHNQPPIFRWPGWSVHSPAAPPDALSVSPEDQQSTSAPSIDSEMTTSTGTPAETEEPNLDLTPSTIPSYISDYTAWLTTLSVAPQLTSFRRGFHALLPVHHIKLFTPSTLKRTLEGSTTLDLSALRRATHYEGYDANEPYMQSFWRVLSRWPPSKQKSLLKFVTAADRIPITGAGALTFKIQEEVRVVRERREEWGNNDLLPSSSTCFGTLYLPRYQSEEVLEKRLSTALEFGGVGFGNA